VAAGAGRGGDYVADDGVEVGFSPVEGLGREAE
jgi:hypothetical protein